MEDSSCPPSNEDWAAKARAWAADKAANDHQHQNSQFTHDSRPEQQSHYYEQYTQSADQHLQDMQQPPVLPSSNHHSITPVAPPQKPSFGHSQEPSFFSPGQSPYVLPYTARDGNFTGDSVASFPQQGNSSISPLVHQQEVPSSYSSIAGKEEAGNRHEAFYGSSPLPANSSHHHHAQLMPAPNKAAVMEERHYVMGPDLSDQPLDFAPRFSHEHDRHSQPYYVRADSGGSVGGADPVDPSVVGASPAPEHTASLFGRAQSSSFHPTVPSVGAHFGVGAGAALHPAAAFPADAYGISDRPKKAAVPNWLREEIIKKKAVITTSTAELPKEDSQSIEDEGVNKSYRKGDQADSKSIDSSRVGASPFPILLELFVEVEAARTAAMNQEIKRVLTEVLLKVTDELFSEIATRVLSEEDLSVDVEQKTGASSQKVLTSVQAVTTPKASAKVLIPLKPKDTHSVNASEKSTSTSPVDLLGLANYASDDEDDNEIQSSDKQKTKEHGNGKSREESEDHDRSPANLEKNPQKMSPNVGTDDRSTRYSAHEDAGGSFKTESRVPEDKMPGGKDAVKTEKTSQTPDCKKTKIDHSRSEDKRDKPDKSGKREVRKGSGTNDNGMLTSSKDRKTEIDEGNHGNHEERLARKEKVGDLDGSKDIVKEKSRNRAGVAIDNGRKRERTKDEKREKSRRKDERGSSRRKRHRSSSNDSRGRESKDKSTRANDPSDESSDDSRRKAQPNRHRSPSPLRSRKRHVSRSPHSKHTQRRRSPYPASESIRYLVGWEGGQGRDQDQGLLIVGEDEQTNTWSQDRVLKTNALAYSYWLPLLARTNDMKDLWCLYLLSACLLLTFATAKLLGLWLIWVWGFILIGVSFYATQFMPLPSYFKGQIKKTMLFNGELVDGPSITIFTAPRPFVGTVGERQALAIRSWLGLSPDISVVLFSQDSSVFSFAELFSHRVSVEPNIDFTSKASSSDVSVVIDPNTVLLSDFIKTIRHAHRLDHDWLLFSSSKSVPHFPFHLDADGKHWIRDDGSRVKTQKDFLSQEWEWNLCEEKMLIAWNSGDLPLHKGVLPPFLYGKGLHNRWLINEALLSDFRFVFDASWAISNLYLNDLGQDFDRTSGNFLGLATGKRFWEVAGNSNLAMLYGSLYFHEQNFSNIFRLFQCGGYYLFINSAQMVVYPLSYKGSSSLGKEVMFKSTIEKNTLECIDTIRSTEGAKDCSVKNYLNVSMPISLSLSLEILLSLRADKNKTVVLAVVGYSYKDMLMSWVCRLNHLQISNFLVCALDDDIYEFCVMQGLPVFKYANLETKISFDNCHFGTECFQKVTKVKSRMVLEILKLGYNVLMSDVDIYWFKNPLPLLSSFGPAVLVAQSDEYKLTGPINLPRRLNSGFYYAHSDAMTIAALEKVVEHAANSNLSEQPSFYDMLCGEGGYNRIDDSRCLEPHTNLTVQFLDRDLFPNGAYKDLWQERNVKEACLMKGCFIIHNNWISGRRKKLERQVPSGLWEYDMSTRMCLQTWHKTKFVYF
uniref:Nucleotide-diphospho-sugar transferase domain-containing protein n=1 Tax=Solanum lycopersicum TaxID=4081 RepID=A0A3Q7GF67_SOLLC